jgi:putative ATPase
MSLVLASAAADAVRLVGLPEAKLNMAQAVIHLALAPKSNSVTVALGLAERDAALPRHDVPAHLRDGHYAGAKSLGHGESYRYPHDDPRGFADQSYRPEDLESHEYYRPLAHGSEPQRSAWRASRRGGDLPSEGA